MKRIFIVALCVSLAVCALAVPASASTYAERWTNVLDYATVNNSDSNYFAVDHNDTISLPLSGNTIVSDIDLVFRSSTPVSSIVLELAPTITFNLIIESLGSNIYRAYGSANNYGFEDLIFRFKLANTSGRAYCELFQCRISAQSVDLFNISASITRSSNVSGSSSHSAGGTSSFSFSSAGDWFVSYKFTDWKKFDFINFSFITNGVIVGSVSAKIGSRVVPVNITSFNGADGDDFQKAYTGYLDLYGIEHDQSNFLELFITGTCSTPTGSSVSVGFINGSVIVESPSFFAIIWNTIKNGFNAVCDWLSSGFNSVVNAIKDAFGGLADEQSQTNDKIDGITDHQPSVETPEGGEIITDIVESEQQVIGSVNSGKDVFEDSVDASIDVLLSRATAFAFFVWMFGLITKIKFFNDLLYFSLGVGAFGLLISLTATLGRNITKSRSTSD